MEKACLYYGPGAQQAALDAAGRIGKLVCPPMGYELPDDINKRKTIKYLSVDAAREAVTHLSSTPISKDPQVVILGPMDRAAPKSSDVLLKSIEEHDPTMVIPILWAFDLDGVRPTIRSRLLAEFAPGAPPEPLDLEYVLSCSLSGDAAGVGLGLLEHKGKEAEILAGLAQGILFFGSPEALTLWNKIRPLTLLHNPTFMEILSVLIGTSEAKQGA
jgi:hypothetical protein